MVRDLSVFRYERQLLRSQRRLENLRLEEAHNRAERLHRGGPARKEKNVDVDVDVNVDVTTLSETALVKSSRNIRTGSQAQELSDAGISTCHTASISPVISPDDGEAPGPVMSPGKKEVKARRRTDVRQPVDTVDTVDNMQAELARWVKSVQTVDDRQPLGTKFRTFIPLRYGSKAVESHSMHERGLKFRGQLDSLEKPHGSGEVVFSNGDTYSGQFADGLRHGQGLVRIKKELMRNIMGEMIDSKVSFIEGSFVADKLEGPGMIEFDNGDLLYCNFARGVIHGFTKTFNSEKKLESVCWYQNGLPFGHSWHFCRGGGFLVGRLDQFGDFSGRDLAFVFPDLRTALYGTFRRGRMVSALPARVRSLVRRDNMISLVFSTESTSSYSWDPATRDCISSRPLLQDPYEVVSVRCGLCKDPSKGEGLFLATPGGVKSGTVLAFYNGVRLTSEECAQPCEDWRDDAYKIMDQTEEENVLDIPQQFRCLSQYRASLAHKANHSFQPNAKFCSFFHPRFGLIPALISLTQISAGVEILVNYEYSFDSCPPWYSQLQVDTMMRAYQQSRL